MALLYNVPERSHFTLFILHFSLKFSTTAVLLLEEAPHKALRAAVAFLFALKNSLLLHRSAGV